jgi:hypothetical protein
VDRAGQALVPLLGGARRHGDGGAFSGESSRDELTDAPAGAGDDSYPAFE